jgi:hypothetical protein
MIYFYSKTLLRLAISRIKLLRNKREIQLKQMKRELVQLLQTNQEASARIRVRKHLEFKHNGFPFFWNDF